MKNQYFGDMYDYIKYGLLRQLSSCGSVTASVCWMLTEDDDSRDGHRVDYLQDPTVWRGFDPSVFDCLRTAVWDRKERNIRSIEESGLLTGMSFYSALLTDRPDQRAEYFDGFLECSHGKELVFFDPDNGLEIKSVKYGRKGASRYLFMREVSRFFAAGHSLLVYQHIPPKPRDQYINDQVSRLTRETGSSSVYVFHTQRVAFFLVSQCDHVVRFSEIASKVEVDWCSLLSIRRFSATNDSSTR